MLEQALYGRPDVRLLDPPVDLVGGYTVQELKEFGYWPPWFEADVDRDGRRDVVAVIVQPGVTSKFGVVAIHAREPGRLHWVWPLADERLNGVAYDAPD